MCRCSNKREEIRLAVWVWASEVDSSMMTMMDLDSEEDSVEEVCSSKCRWVAAWEEVVDFNLSNLLPFQVEALLNQSRQKHISRMVRE